MSVRVKICGITNENDLKFISMLDVDFIGFNLVKGTKRAISEANLVKLSKMLPSYIVPVCVVMNCSINDVKRIRKKTGINHFQFHGNEDPDFLKKAKEFDIKIIKVFRPRTVEEVESAKNFLQVCDYFLVDAYDENLPGGTGLRVDIEIAKKFKEFEKPFFLAGGLTPENVREVIKEVEPFAVDVASGVEKTPRTKDIDKVRAFISAVKKGI